MKLKFDTDTTFVVFRLLKAHQCTCELILHINQVLQGHLLKAVEFVPLSASTDCVEGEVRVEDVSDELTAGVCKVLHEIELKFEKGFKSVLYIYSLHYVQREYIY